MGNAIVHDRGGLALHAGCKVIPANGGEKVFLMNTGRIGGKADDERSKKVKIPFSSAIVQGIAENTIKWTDAPEFGYEVAEDVPGIDDVELLQPWRLYERQGRTDEYRE